MFFCVSSDMDIDIIKNTYIISNCMPLSPEIFMVIIRTSDKYAM